MPADPERRRQTPGARTGSDNETLRIALLATARFPIAEPFVGGLEAHTWQLAHGLVRRGHRVTVFAGEGSDPSLDVRPFAGAMPVLSETARGDVTMEPEQAMYDHHAYQSAMVQLAQDAAQYDVIHNNSVHHLPLALSPVVPTAQVTTLHTPPTVWMELAIKASPQRLPVRFCAVSRHTAASWQPTVPDATVVANAVDLGRWPIGPGGDDAVWSGRIVPEKGLHLAIDAARCAGMRLRIAGPILDTAYWDDEVAPRLGTDAVWEGHLDQRSLADLVGHSSVAVVSPCWDEPYGLVALEALACGTPVAAVGRGGLVEVLDQTCSVMVTGEHAVELGAAMRWASTLPRAAARRRAERIGSVDRMIDAYVDVYRSCLR